LELVTKYFGSELVAGIADNAAELADVIAESTFSQEVIFFCGDQRRRDLPDSLREKGIEVIEIVVYQTLAVPKRLKKRYVGVLFFSPTAVNSYFKLNKANDNTIFFAIGETTARAIKQHTNKKILISESPGKEELVNIAIEFFS
jgi:uroporphyrinogen-III synthase